MRKENLAGSIGIESPCSQEWEEMSGNEKTRFCSHCEFNVNDISLMTEDEAWKLIKKSNGNLCVRFESHPVTNAPIFAGKLYQITRQTGVAAGVLGATLAVSTSAFAQKTPGNISIKQQTTVSSTKQTKNTPNQTNKQPQTTPTPIRPKRMGKIAIRRIITNPLMIAVQQGKALKVRLMIATGVKINEKDTGYYSRTALHIAVESNDLKMAQMLLNAGADVKLKDNYHQTPLMNVRGNTSGEMIRLLAQHGADLNATGRSGQTALFGAVQYDNLEAVKALLEIGADATIKDDFGNSVLIHTRSEAISQLLMAYGAEQNKD